MIVGGRKINWAGFAVVLMMSFALSAYAQQAPTTAMNDPPQTTQSSALPCCESTKNFAALMHDLAVGSYSTKKKAVTALADLRDARVLPVLQALVNRENPGIKLDPKNQRLILRLNADLGIDVVSGQQLQLATIKLAKVRVNNAVISKIKRIISRLQLAASDASVRRKAAIHLVENIDESARTVVLKRLATETDSNVKNYLALALAKLDLHSDRVPSKLAAIKKIETMRAINLIADLNRLVEKDTTGAYLEQNPSVRAAAQASLRSLESRAFWYSRIRDLIFGISSGSILLLMALGLAITFGLMGVINMAHGEMLMLGAYTTYFVQEFFAATMPNLLGWYVVAALPVAFIVTAAIGMALERSVIRFLYGRPLDTLLVTWGISMIIIQIVRLGVGAANVTVANPHWLKGGIELLPGQIFPFARLATILFALLIVLLVWYLLNRTSLGLKVRAVQQNRSMAACMGINTASVDMWTFGLGAGIAGIAGVALSQILLVGPNLGQSLIIESFMVVVTGGVGNLVGTVVGAYGLGLIDKILEPVVGPAMIKVCLLVLIIAFIQWRPEGLFPPKGRVEET